MAGARVSDFFTRNPNPSFFSGRGGGARVSEFYLLRIQISKIKKNNNNSGCGGEGSWSK